MNNRPFLVNERVRLRNRPMMRPLPTSIEQFFRDFQEIDQYDWLIVIQVTESGVSLMSPNQQWVFCRPEADIERVEVRGLCLTPEEWAGIDTHLTQIGIDPALVRTELGGA